MVALHATTWTESEYLAHERASDAKHEFLRGEIVAMAGASSRHNLIVASTIVALGTHLRGSGCRFFASDMRVKVAADVYTYPDVSVVCGSPQFADQETLDTLLNPSLIVEVLSPSTEAYDRGRKFIHYQSLASLQEYVLVAQDEPRVERFLRQDGDKWLLESAAGSDGVLSLESIGAALALADVYAQVSFEAERGAGE